MTCHLVSVQVFHSLEEGNLPKIWEKHKVSWAECEQMFFNHPLVAARDEKHSVVFTIRKGLARPISARDMNRKERKVYESS